METRNHIITLNANDKLRISAQISHKAPGMCHHVWDSYCALVWKPGQPACVITCNRIVGKKRLFLLVNTVCLGDSYFDLVWKLGRCNAQAIYRLKCLKFETTTYLLTY